jgi:DNA-binding MarR family transcriptional regulator
MFAKLQAHMQARKQDIKISWIPFLLILDEEISLDIKTLALRRSVTLAAVSQIVKELEFKGYITLKVNKNDLRSKQVSLNENGKNLVLSLKPQIENLEKNFHLVLSNFKSEFFQQLNNFELIVSRMPVNQTLGQKYQLIRYSNFNLEDFIRFAKKIKLPASRYEEFISSILDHRYLIIEDEVKADPIVGFLCANNLTTNTLNLKYIYLDSDVISKSSEDKLIEFIKYEFTNKHQKALAYNVDTVISR